MVLQLRDVNGVATQGYEWCYSAATYVKLLLQLVSVVSLVNIVGIRGIVVFGR